MQDGTLLEHLGKHADAIVPPGDAMRGVLQRVWNGDKEFDTSGDDTSVGDTFDDDEPGDAPSDGPGGNNVSVDDAHDDVASGDDSSETEDLRGEQSSHVEPASRAGVLASMGRATQAASAAKPLCDPAMRGPAHGVSHVQAAHGAGGRQLARQPDVHVAAPGSGTSV